MDHGPAAPEAERARSWAASGAMALTGWPDEAPVVPAGPVGPRLDAVAREIEQLTGEAGTPVPVDWGALLTGRAALLGLRRQGRTSANGSCRLLPAGEGWVALNLSRPDDLDALDALVGRTVGGDPWPVVERFAARSPAASFVARARLLGMPAAVLARPPAGVEAAQVQARWPASPSRPLPGLRVVDLSSMWAGPLAARILTAAGAEVTTIESRTRPDGARATPAFFRWLHPHGQEQVTLDFATPAGRGQLRAWVEHADVVIEGSRPRALQQLGVGPDSVGDRAGRVWLSITGHGRESPGGEWVGFGDDAAVAGGLVAWDERGEPVFCGDAIADPASGLLGALAVLRALQAGGGQLIDLALARVAATLAADPGWGAAPPGPRAHRSSGGGWELPVGGAVTGVRDPIPPADPMPC